MTDKERIQIIKKGDFHEAYDHIVDMSWWSDSGLVNDKERRRMLHEDFVAYVDIVCGQSLSKRNPLTGARKELGHSEKLNIIWRLRTELARQLKRVENKDYESTFKITTPMAALQSKEIG